MCGIAGIIALGEDLKQGEQSHIRTMTALLHHRGPDQRGYRIDARCALGNTRLKILDLSSKADLPMANEDETVILSYNGEVTNFRELRREFRLDERFSFRTTSDTEVILRLYEHLGIDFLKHLTGQFAFALLDRRRMKLWIVRDFYGIRPLFYMHQGRRLYFASEIKALLDLPCFDGRLDHEGFFHYFSLAYIPEQHTPFQMIKELQGGELLEVDLATGRLTERQYYEIHYEPDHSLTEEEVAPLLYEQMKDSVRRNLISDAPVGMTFSGGFDTSSILALARELVGEDQVHTFSIAIEEPSFDESHYQRLMVDPARHPHHEIKVGPLDVMEALNEHMVFMDEPSGDGAAVPFYLLAREASKYVKVLLSGEGGDETFNAYETHLANKIRRLYRGLVPSPVRWLALRAAHALPCDYRKLSFDFLAKRFTTGAELGVPEAHLYWRHVLPEEEKLELMPQCTGMRPTNKLFSDLYHSLDFEDELNRISVMDLKHYFIGDLMVKNDRTLMAHSIEARLPFMDRLLLDFMGRVPPELRIKGITRRYIQKQAMKDKLPEAIYRRQNMGLEMPHSIWFFDAFRPLAEHYFSKKSIDKTGVLHHGTVKRLWEEHQGRKRDNGRVLWCIINLLVWLDRFVYEGDYKKYLSLS